MSNSPVTKRQHLALICQRIGQHVGTLYGGELNAMIEQSLCSDCLARLQEPTDENLAPPEEAAKTLLRRAAGLKKSIPTRARFEVDSELKKKLEALFEVFVRTLAGEHRVSSRPKAVMLGDVNRLIFLMPSGDAKAMTPVELRQNLLWAELSKDGTFMRRLMVALEAYGEQMTYERFRQEVLDACVKAKVGSAEKAIPVLDQLTRSYAAQYLS